jgi:uncharacterized protein (UPF0216 family)
VIPKREIEPQISQIARILKELAGQTHLKLPVLLAMKSTKRKVAKVAETNAEFFLNTLFAPSPRFSLRTLPLCVSLHKLP